MKYLLAIMVGLFATTAVYAEAETKKACVKQMDPKTKKEKEVCKTIKVHKKLEGTAIPDNKKK
jgi:hypothetical protein